MSQSHRTKYFSIGGNKVSHTKPPKVGPIPISPPAQLVQPLTTETTIPRVTLQLIQTPPKKSPRQVQLKPPYPYIIVVGGDMFNPANRVQTAHMVGRLMNEWARKRRAQGKKWLNRNRTIMPGRVTHLGNMPFHNEVMEGFIVFGIAEHEREESSEMLKEMAAAIMVHWGRVRLGEVHFLDNYWPLRFTPAQAQTVTPTPA